MTRVSLSEQTPITLDIAGNGTARLGPITAREVWYPANIHVTVSTNVLEAVCEIFVGDGTGNNNFRDATFTGSSGDSTDKVNADVIKKGHFIFAKWTGGDPGSQAILLVTGEKEV